MASMARKKRFTVREGDANRIMLLWAKGQRRNAIADVTGFSYATVCKVIKARGYAGYKETTDPAPAGNKPATVTTAPAQRAPVDNTDREMAGSYVKLRGKYYDLLERHCALLEKMV